MRAGALALSMPIALALAGAAVAGEITAADLASQSAEVVILGEIHDNPVHHANQAEAVRHLAPKALVFEMLTPEQAAKVTPDLRADAGALGAALGWEASGWPDFGMYHPIFMAAPEARIYGAAVPDADLPRAMTDGAAAVFGDEAGRFGLTEPLAADDLAARVAEQDEAHCKAMPAAMLPGMVEVQRLRDAAFARTALRALADTGGPVAVITGSGHARTDTGIPAALRKAAPGVTVVSLGQVERGDGVPTDGLPYDVWIVTEAAERPDPCLVFTK